MKPLALPRMSQVTAAHASWDLHAHADFVDGRNSVAEMAEAAQARGLTVLAFTEHARSSFQSWWPRYVEAVRAARAKENGGLEIVLGLEANAIGAPGHVDLTPDMWRDADLVLGAVHGYYDAASWDRVSPEALGPEAALGYEIEHLCGLCENPGVQVLAHPFWLYRRHFGEPSEAALRRVLEKARATDTAVEINFRHLGDWRMFRGLLRDIDPLVSPGSNAHAAEELSEPAAAARRLFG